MLMCISEFFDTFFSIFVLLLFSYCNVFSSSFSLDSLVQYKIDHWIITFQKGQGHLLCPIRMLMAQKLILILVEILEGI